MAPGAESLDQSLRTFDEAGKLGLEVDEVAVDEARKPQEHRRHDQGQQRSGQSRGHLPAQDPVDRQDRVGQEDRQSQRAEQRGQLLEEIPAPRRTQHGRSQCIERHQLGTRPCRSLFLDHLGIWHEFNSSSRARSVIASVVGSRRCQGRGGLLWTEGSAGSGRTRGRAGPATSHRIDEVHAGRTR